MSLTKLQKKADGIGAFDQTRSATRVGHVPKAADITTADKQAT